MPIMCLSVKRESKILLQITNQWGTWAEKRKHLLKRVVVVIRNGVFVEHETQTFSPRPPGLCYTTWNGIAMQIRFEIFCSMTAIRISLFPISLSVIINMRIYDG